MSSLFEKEFAQNALDLEIDSAGKLELLRKARLHCSRLADTFTRSETAANAISLAEALLVRSFSGHDASNVAKAYCAMIADDKETGTARSSDLAELTTDADFFERAKKRGGLSATFTLSDREISRLRAMVA